MQVLEAVISIWPSLTDSTNRCGQHGFKPRGIPAMRREETRIDQHSRRSTPHPSQGEPARRAVSPPAQGVLVNAQSPLGAVALARDLLAFTGAALTCSTLAGPRLGWTLPLAWAILPAIVSTRPGSDPTGLLTLATQADSAALPLAAAVIIWLLGTALATSGAQINRLP